MNRRLPWKESAGSGRRSGLTLLELLLALALSSMIMVAISMAIDLHLRSLASRRTSVEEILLARAVLNMIRKDLRSAVAYEPLDFSGVEDLAESQLGGLDELAELAGAAEEETPDAAIASSVEPPPRPGVYGNQYELQIDVSRLPRVDQYQSLLDPRANLTATDIPSDVKTVAYYLQGNNGSLTSLAGPTAATNALSGQSSLGGQAIGLVRRELDRAVTQWAVDSGSSDQLAAGGELLAPEVVWIEFAYYDGIEWYAEWDSDLNGGLPIAVRVVIYLQPAGQAAGSVPPDLSLSQETLGTGGYLRFESVVRLPLAKPVSTGELDDLEALGL